MARKPTKKQPSGPSGPVRQRKQQQNSASKARWHITVIEFRVITFVATLALAAVAIVLHPDEPVIWSFLQTALGVALGQALQKL